MNWARKLRRAAALLVVLLAALVFPAILGGADEASGGAPPGLLEWPRLPGESLRQLAQLTYPQDRAMQRHFIDAAMRENSATFTNFGADQKFDEETRGKHDYKKNTHRKPRANPGYIFTPQQIQHKADK